jgi:hypothetical protein
MTVQYSGKSINDFGNMRACILDESMKYFFLKFDGIEVKISFMMGFCVSNVCD